MSEEHVQPRPGVLEGDPDPADGRVVVFSPRNIWRIGWTIFALIVLWNIQAGAGRAVVRLCENEFGITRRQWRLLAHLAQHEGLQPSELALHVGLDRARTSRALTGLVHKQLVRRLPRPPRLQLPSRPVRSRRPCSRWSPAPQPVRR